MPPPTQISRRQQALVDTCFEESLYEAGLSILDKIRTADAAPPTQHVQQLLYLALYPVDSPNIPQVKPTVKPIKRRGTKPKPEVPSPPSPPSQEAVDLALGILHHFLCTNSPRSLLSVIPSYEHRPEPQDEDSLVKLHSLAYHAACITRAKHCWDILMPEYVLPDSDETSKARAGSIGENAWGVLGWLVEAFERDAQDNGGVSSLLVAQLPKPAGGGLRTAINAPLDLVFEAFSDPLKANKANIGSRLLDLLLRLAKASPPKLSADRLVFECCRRLEALSLAGYSAFMERITDAYFRLALSCSFIIKHSEAHALPPFASPTKQFSRDRRDQEPVPTTGKTPSTHTYSYVMDSPERALAILQLRIKLQENTDMDEDDTVNPSMEEQKLRYATMKLNALSSIHQHLEHDSRWRDAVAIWARAAMIASSSLSMSSLLGTHASDIGDVSVKMAAIELGAASYVDGWREMFVSH